MGNFFYIETQEGVPSLGFKEGTEEIRLHSTYRPLSEAKRFVELRKDQIKRAKKILIYGLGLGYHLEEMENYRRSDSQIYVVEMNPEILPYTEKGFPLEKFKQKGYNFCITNKLQQVKSFLVTILAEFDLERDLLLIHRPSLRIVPKNCTPIRHLLEELEVTRDSCQRHSGLLKRNFLENIQKSEEFFLIDPLHQKFLQIPIIIVSAGPSLQKNIHLLKQAKGRSLIIAVGSVVRPLIDKKNYPDCIVISDPVPVVIKQIRGLDLKLPFFFLPTIQPEIVNTYLGPKVMLLQKGVTFTENYARQTNSHLIATGGSVATTALEVALYLGGNPIIFLGQDLAYTNGKTHIPGTTHDPWIPKINSRFRFIQGIDGELVPTSNSLSIYKRWIERKIANNPDRRFINATEGGADIQGTIIRPFASVLKNLTQKYSIEQIFNQVLGKGG